MGAVSWLCLGPALSHVFNSAIHLANARGKWRRGKGRNITHQPNSVSAGRWEKHDAAIFILTRERSCKIWLLPSCMP